MDAITSAEDFVLVRQTLAGRAAEARVLARRKMAPRRAVDPMSPIKVVKGRVAAPIGYHFTYADADGVVTDRVVTLRRIDPAREGLRLWCFCHAAQDLRMFWAHRIQEVFCVVTGEVHDDAVTFFDNHPMLCEPQDPEAYALKVLRHEIDLLTIVAAADGVVDENELDRIVVHVFDRLPQMRLQEDVLRHRLALLMPDSQAFENALIQMGRYKAGDPISMMRTMRKVVDADLRIAPEELVFVEEISRRLVRRLGEA